VCNFEPVHHLINNKVCFNLFDVKKQDFLSGDDLGDIMRAMGFRPTDEELKDLLEEVRLSLESSASCAQPSWWRTLIWRPCRRS